MRLNSSFPYKVVRHLTFFGHDNLSHIGNNKQESFIQAHHLHRNHFGLFNTRKCLPKFSSRSIALGQRVWGFQVDKPCPTLCRDLPDCYIYSMRRPKPRNETSFDTNTGFIQRIRNQKSYFENRLEAGMGLEASPWRFLIDFTGWSG